MKYIVVVKEFGMEVPVIFPNFAQHSDMVPEFGKVVSAGECSINSNELFQSKPKVTCWGESISLGVKSRKEEDEWLLNKAIENY